MGDWINRVKGGVKGGEEAAHRKHIDPHVVDWIMAMLRSRTVETGSGCHQVAARVTQGCPQGGVLSPLRWSLVVDELLVELSDHGMTAGGYADDLAIMVRGKYDDVLSSCLQASLNRTWNWCQKVGLTINPSKSTIIPFRRRRNLNLNPITLNGCVIEFKKEVKYLGLLLDSKLTWNAHIQYICQKATKTLWICKKMVGRMWGLKPHISAWIYTSVVKPIITYGCLVWWNKTTQVTASKQLQKVQRLACLTVTGAFKTCPTMAIEALLGWEPLCINITRITAQQVLTASLEKALKPGNLTGHPSLLKRFSDTPIEVGHHELTKKEPLLNNSFEVEIPTREDWAQNHVNLGDQESIWFTDGSKTESGCGLGIYGPNTRISLPLGPDTSVFQTEIMAVTHCVTECRKYLATNTRLNHNTALNGLADSSPVTLIWVPGHTNIEGNNICDSLAKEAARTPFTGLLPIGSLTKNQVREMLKTKADSEFRRLWLRKDGLRKAKMFIAPDGKWSKQALSLNKNQLRTLVALLTGHGAFNSHVHRLGLSDNVNCRYCKQETEDNIHILCSCPAIQDKRRRFLGRDTCPPSSIKQSKVVAILAFARSIELEL
ncbi:Odorant receptor [Sergentomyia squamirostris]